jgi:hypothetical protein
VSVARTRRAEMLEVERQNRKVPVLRDGHDRGVDDAQTEVGERGVDFGRASEKRGGEEDDRVLRLRHRCEKAAGGLPGNAGAKELVDLDQHEVGNEKIAADSGHEVGSERVGDVAPIRSSDERTGIRDDVQRASTNSSR